jgi:hypothetical protein
MTDLLGLTPKQSIGVVILIIAVPWLARKAGLMA